MQRSWLKVKLNDCKNIPYFPHRICVQKTTQNILPEEPTQGILSFITGVFPGVLPITINYKNITLEQVRTVVTTSEDCHYTIKIQHTNVRLSDYSFWMSFNGEKVDWAKSTDRMCQGKYPHCLVLLVLYDAQWWFITVTVFI